MQGSAWDCPSLCLETRRLIPDDLGPGAGLIVTSSSICWFTEFKKQNFHFTFVKLWHKDITDKPSVLLE